MGVEAGRWRGRVERLEFGSVYEPEVLGPFYGGAWDGGIWVLVDEIVGVVGDGDAVLAIGAGRVDW